MWLVRAKTFVAKTGSLDLFSFSALRFPGEVYPETVGACLWYFLFFPFDVLDVSGRDIQQIMSLLFLLSSWNTVLLPVEFRSDH